MSAPPFLLKDGYRDHDREGKRDFSKKGSEKKLEGEYAPYNIPLWRGFFMQSYQRNPTDCAFFEAQWYKCMEAFGAKLGRIHCDLEHRDLNECVTNDKKVKRYVAMREVRFKKWLTRERKTIWEPTQDYLNSVKYDTAGQTNKVQGQPQSKWD